MRHQEMVADSHRGSPVGDAGRENSVTVPQHRRHPGLVLSDPVSGVLTQGAGHDAGIPGEGIDRGPRCPSTFLLQRLWQVPVIERGVRRNAPSSQPGDEAAIEVETGLIHPSVAVRDDTRPRDREPVGGDSEIGEQIGSSRMRWK